MDVFGEGRLSAEAVEFIRMGDLVNRTERDHWLASVFVTGSLFDAWAGPVDVALGAEWRRDEISFNADDALFTGDTLGYGWTAPVEGSESVAEIYAEAIVPLADGRTGARYLGLEAGVRYSDYDIAGGMWTYKAGGEWEPVDGLRFRVMHQRSARAPNSTELFEAQRTVTGWYTAFDTSFDRCSASANPVENGNVDKCLMQGLPMDQIGVFEATPFYPVDYLLGGNPDLVPETGDTWTAGFVFSPSFLSNWTLSADYFEFEVTDTIGGIDAGLICFDPVNTGNVFCENITRDATGNVADVTQLTSNRGILETTGVDVQLQYSRELPDWMALRGRSAEIDVNVFWTHMISHEEQANLASQVMDCAGYYGWPCDNDARTSVYPGNRVTSKLHYVSGPLQMHLTWRWIDGTRNADSLLPRLFGWDERELAVPKIGSEQYLDVGIAYRFGQHMTGRFGVTNLLDNDPPQMADAVWDNNTETGLYDVFGRSYYLRLSAEY